MLTKYPNASSPARDTIWVDLLDPSDDEIAKALADYGISVPSRQQLEEIESSSRLRADGDVLILSMTIASKSDLGESMPTPVGFVLTPKLLLTVRYAELHAIAPALERIGKDTTPGSVDMFATLVEAMVDYAADILEQSAKKLNAISQRVFKRYGRTREGNFARSNRALKDTLVEVGALGDQLSHIRDSILGLQRIAPYALDKGQKWIGDAVQARLKTVSQDLLSLADFEVHLTDKVQFLLDAVLGFINTKQNEIFTVLTIVSVVGIPPTLVASIYGMNFKNMPELDWAWGNQFGLCLIALSTILPILWFKWRGWL